MVIGYPVDFFVNKTFMTLLLFELPQWQHGEDLVTDRPKRTPKAGTDLRL